MEKVEEARFLTSRVEEEASLSMVLRSISLRDECPSHDSSKTFKAIHCKLRSRCLALPSWWVFVHCFLVKLKPTRIIVRELLLE
mmetsp:Transcript_42175/g.78111  ORF Transcript_42175/g.78111 Transcript_42175/m.78111 type:complete len:84 (-) Transcript_42175:42-293(-)